MDVDQIKHNFTYHPPTDDDVMKHTILREKAQELAILIAQLCPDSREKDIAIMKVDEVNMWSNAAIARNK